MNCRNHTERAGINTCSRCGDWLCSECSVEVNGRNICKSCIAAMVDGQPRNPSYPPVPPPPPSPHGDYCGAPPRPRRCDAPRSGRYISWGVLFLFSVINPGINYMYEGLIKRGLFTLSSFYLLVYLAGTFSQPLFAFAGCIIWLTSIFDAFQIRRRINSGEHVPDDVSDITGFLRRHRVAIVLATLALIVLSLLNNASWIIRKISYMLTGSYGFSGSYAVTVVHGLLPLAIVAAGIYFIVKAVSGRRCRRRDYYHHHYDAHPHHEREMDRSYDEHENRNV